jgi:hypothetical protein
MKYIIMANGKNEVVYAHDIMDLICYQLTEEQQKGLQAIVVWEELKENF